MRDVLLPLIVCLTFSSCDKDAGGTASAPEAKPATTVSKPRDIPTAPETQFNIGNKSYLFDVSDHSLEELKAVLIRAEEISSLQTHEYGDLEIVMILHGPDIDWFVRENQEHNRKLIDLAARLDALDLIDMKVCETTMKQRGVRREDVPAFIESVPYAPDEMKRLLQEGYVNL
jgi:Uncharacterized conserved protein